MRIEHLTLSLAGAAAHGAAATAIGAVSLARLKPDAFTPSSDAAVAGLLGATLIHAVGLGAYSAVHCGRAKPIEARHLLAGVTTAAALGGLVGGAILTLTGAHLHARPLPLLAAGAVGTAILSTATALAAVILRTGMDWHQRHQAHGEGHEPLAAEASQPV